LQTVEKRHERNKNKVKIGVYTLRVQVSYGYKCLAGKKMGNLRGVYEHFRLMDACESMANAVILPAE
jgi:hypothetical protein